MSGDVVAKSVLTQYEAQLNTLRTQLAAAEAAAKEATQALEAAPEAAEEKVEAFEKSLEQVDDLRKKLDGRIANICSVVGGDVPITTSYTDLNTKLSKRIANIPVEHNAVAKKVRQLANFDN